MATSDHTALRAALTELLARAESGELPPAEFEAQLDVILERLDPDAHGAAAEERRRAAVMAYGRLASQEGMDRHHHLERLAQALESLVRDG
jgi:hypothetical protein